MAMARLYAACTWFCVSVCVCVCNAEPRSAAFLVCIEPFRVVSLLVGRAVLQPAHHRWLTFIAQLNCVFPRTRNPAKCPIDVAVQHTNTDSKCIALQWRAATAALLTVTIAGMHSHKSTSRWLPCCWSKRKCFIYIGIEPMHCVYAFSFQCSRLTRATPLQWDFVCT